jgi:hypothetical protein
VSWVNRILNLFRREQVDEELEEERQFHLEPGEALNVSLRGSRRGRGGALIAGELALVQPFGRRISRHAGERVEIGAADSHGESQAAHRANELALADLNRPILNQDRGPLELAAAFRVGLRGGA